MNENQLSKRLHSVASYIERGMRIADIGSDHAYLPCYAVKHRLTPFAVAGEVVEGPLRSAMEQVKKAGLTEWIDVRKGDGLEVLEAGEVDCITIAGMGGPLIAHILEGGKDKLKDVTRLVLQPNVGANHVRRWLLDHEWELLDEQILEEDGKIYEILVAEQGEPLRPYNHLQAELLLGPFLLKGRSSSFEKKWSQELNVWEKILNSMENAQDSPETETRKRELKEKITIVKEALA